ncbi:uncharacterized protein LY89DRAFT_676109 [Mollisia scopiformis]|uniref:Uncharacterized protein n=1 Tax=Mollisia scopiformis TaxID=149040 RepID=A0A132BAK5_MOLSC|nr:uncharacterized protein LY89DRAFT_676109 [Mollisia scopiformis]KUJ09303.1 hypothetical protein LY89DRAFT_676109 [Mollisia scopiformis]
MEDTKSYHDIIEANKDSLRIFHWIYWVFLSGSTGLWAIVITWSILTYESRRKRALRLKEIEEYALDEVGQDSDSAVEDLIEDLVRDDDVEQAPQDPCRISLLSKSRRDQAGGNRNGYGAI